MAKHDIVYILRNDINESTDELRYSLRSVERNFPYNKIYFYGGKPKGLQPDVQIELQQQGFSRWQKVCNTLHQVCLNDDITPDFWLFNDDFFVIRKQTDDIPVWYKNVSVRKRCDELRKNGGVSFYQRQLLATANKLSLKGYGDIDYSLHIPMLINRAKALEALNLWSTAPMFRTLYGNYCKLGGILRADVKIQDLETVPDPGADFLSTNEASFKNGEVGKFIRKKFNRKIAREI